MEGLREVPVLDGQIDLVTLDLDFMRNISRWLVFGGSDQEDKLGRGFFVDPLRNLDVGFVPECTTYRVFRTSTSYFSAAA